MHRLRMLTVAVTLLALASTAVADAPTRNTTASAVACSDAGSCPLPCGPCPGPCPMPCATDGAAQAGAVTQ